MLNNNFELSIERDKTTNKDIFILTNILFPNKKSQVDVTKQHTALSKFLSINEKAILNAGLTIK